MTWFRVDDSFPSHPKVRRIARASRMATLGAWATLGAYSAKHLTDGLVSEDDVLDEGATEDHAKTLVAVGLWHPPGVACGHPESQCPGAPADGFYQFHDWFDYQRSRADVLAERAAAAERQRRARERAKEARLGVTPFVTAVVTGGVSHGVTDGVTSPVSHGPPDPTRPDLGGAAREARCARHAGDPTPPPCGACADARRAAAARPTPVPSRPHCPLHPQHETGSKACPDCTAAAAPAPVANLRAAVRGRREAS